MSKWNNIPNETLRLIFLELESQRDYYNCLYVNKQWFGMVQPFIYFSITINSFQAQNNLVHTLLHSQYSVGSFVKRLQFNDNLTPVSESQWIKTEKNPTGDILYGLMVKCPYVQEVSFHERFIKKSQVYFLMAIEKVAVWQLRKIPGPEYFTNYSQYLRLTRAMEPCLEHIVVRQPERYATDYDHLVRCSGLNSLEIEYEEEANLKSGLSIMEKVPQVSKLTLKFDPKKHIGDLVFTAVDNAAIRAFPNIKTLELSSYKPIAIEAELDFMMATFPKLECFKMDTLHRYWKDLAHNSFFMDTFYDFITKIPTYEMKLKLNPSDYIDRRMKLYKQYVDAIQHKVDHKVIEFTYGGSSSEYAAIMSNEKLEFAFGEKRELVNEKILNMVKRFGIHGQEIRLKFDVGHKISISDCITAVLTHCKNMHRFMLTGGMINSGFEAIKSHSAKELVLYSVNVMPNALYDFSTTFKQLDYIKLDECKFAGTDDDSTDNAMGYFNIALPKTEIDTLELIVPPNRRSYSQSAKSNIFITANCFKNLANPIKFYIVRNDGKEASQVSQMGFANAKAEFRGEEQIIAFSLTAQYINTFLFEAPSSGLKFKLNL
jgi:hypothetical protein